MKVLKKVFLSQKDTIKFLVGHLSGINALSDSLLEHLNFEDGHFYTFLLKDIAESDFHEFKKGYMSSGAFYDDLFFQELIKKNQNFTYIFDSINNYPEDLCIKDFYNFYGKHFNKEVYFSFPPQKINNKNFQEALSNSDAIWHSLLILTKQNLGEEAKGELSKIDFKNICKKTEMFFLMAYDGEGYIIWESKKNDKTPYSVER